MQSSNIDKNPDKESKSKPFFSSDESCPHMFFATIKVQTTSYTMCLNSLKKEQIKLYSIVRESPKILRLTVSQKELVKTFAILDKMCYNYSVLEQNTPKTIFKLALSKVAMIASLIVFIAFYIFSYGFVWSINVVGCDTLDPLIIENILSQNGVEQFSKKSDLDCSNLELLVNSHEQILLSSISISGTTLVIEVVEVTEFTDSPSSSTQNITSEFDATITKIIGYSGTVAVDVGQHVFAGDDLILASRLNTAGEEIATVASGIVYGMVTKTLIYDVTLSQLESVRTGNSYTITSFSMFGATLFEQSYDGFDLYETQTTTTELYDNFFVPITCSQTTYYEKELVSVEYTLQELMDDYSQQAFVEYIMPNQATDYKITTTSKQLDEGIYRIYLFLQAELIIGQEL